MLNASLVYFKENSLIKHTFDKKILCISHSSRVLKFQYYIYIDKILKKNLFENRRNHPPKTTLIGLRRVIRDDDGPLDVFF